MAAEAGVGGRVYQEIKQAIIKGDLKLRQRLDIEELARRFRASATPVRQALAVLMAERLVSVQEARGYYVSFWSERELKDLYEWRWRLAALAASTYTAAPMDLAPALRRSHADAYGELMRHLASAANPEIRRAAQHADERLHAALRAEPDALADTEREIAALRTALCLGGRPLQNVLRRHFARRIAASSAIRARAHANAMPTNHA